jgi:hypothetical protein
MSDATKLRRKRRFQVHLSTAVILMIAAGGWFGRMKFQRGYAVHQEAEIQGQNLIRMPMKISIFIFTAGRRER